MPQTSDNLAEEFQITRELADTFALASQQKYAAAKADGFFDGEIKPVTYTAGRKGPEVTVAEDEHPRPKTDIDALAKLRPLYQGALTPAGHASGLNDGDVALLVRSLKAGESAPAEPNARILSTASHS